MITIQTDRLTIRESSGRDFSRIYAMLLSANTAAGESDSGRISGMDSAGGMGSEEGMDNAGGMGSEDSMHCAGSSAGLFGVSTDEDVELEKYLAYIHTVYSVFGFGLCSVVLKKTGEVIGWCGLQPVGDEDSPLGRIELGYLIDQDYRRQGYAFEACRAILDFAFSRLELDEVYAVIDEKNEASLRLAEKLGFIRKKGLLWTAVPFLIKNN